MMSSVTLRPSEITFGIYKQGMNLTRSEQSFSTYVFQTHLSKFKFLLQEVVERVGHLRIVARRKGVVDGGGCGTVGLELIAEVQIDNRLPNGAVDPVVGRVGQHSDLHHR